MDSITYLVLMVSSVDEYGFGIDDEVRKQQQGYFYRMLSPVHKISIKYIRIHSVRVAILKGKKFKTCHCMVICQLSKQTVSSEWFRCLLAGFCDFKLLLTL